MSFADIDNSAACKKAEGSCIADEYGDGEEAADC
jgi:hypothetical protein